MMANVVLHRLDRTWHEHHRRLGVLIRYADDLVILCPSGERAEQARATLEDILAGMGLSLSAAKTSLVDLREPGRGFDFLGFHHRRVESFTRKGRFFCARWPSQRAVRAARDKIRGHTARRRLLLPAEWIAEDLNRFLAGWRGYFAVARRGSKGDSDAVKSWGMRLRPAVDVCAASASSPGARRAPSLISVRGAFCLAPAT